MLDFNPVLHVWTVTVRADSGTASIALVPAADGTLRLDDFEVHLFAHLLFFANHWLESVSLEQLCEETRQQVRSALGELELRQASSYIVSDDLIDRKSGEWKRYN